MKKIRLKDKSIGENAPVFIIAEIGLNHNGDLKLAKKLIDAAIDAGCDAVKFQKRDPQLCVPPEQRDLMRETPWGYISYMDYRYKVEFEKGEYDAISDYCNLKGILWTASCWDINSLTFIDNYKPAFHKIPSALITDDFLLSEYSKLNVPIIMSTGMSTKEEIDHAVEILISNNADFALLHCTSTYPCPENQINLKVINYLSKKYGVPVGYSGHETGIIPTILSVGLGAKIIERHITLDRSMWGSDQSASVEPVGLIRLVNGIRSAENSLGDGKKVVYSEEEKIKKKLRFKS